MNRLGVARALCCLLRVASALRTVPRTAFHPGHTALHVTRLHRYEHAGVDATQTASSTTPVPKTASRTAIHPGHTALHVTRLHRYEHAGMDSMLEAEARWHFETKSQGSGATTELTSSATADPPLFLKISGIQNDALRDHHSSWLQEGASSVHKIVGSQEQDDVLHKNQPSAVLMQAVRKYHGGRHEANDGATTRLTSVSSQYVGPIGVGTVAQPSGCEVNQDQDVKYVQWGDATAHSQRTDSASGGAEQCHIEDESQVWVVFDTGSTNLWVASDLCTEGPCTYEGRHRYNHTRSPTYQAPENPLELNVQFGTGSVEGPQGVDDFHIGPFAVFNQTFAMMRKQEGPVFEQVPFEGILGLAFKSMSANHVTPFFDNIVDQKALKHNEFAIYFSKDDVTSNGIFWGGVDHSFFKGPIEYFPVTDPYYWSTDLHSFKIGSEELIGIARGGASSLLQQSVARKRAEPTVKAIVDTGTTFFTAEDGLFEEIMARLHKARCGDMTDESHPPITYTLRRTDGVMKDFVLKNNEYMTSAGKGVGALCSPGFMRINIPKAHGPAMVLGECFLRQYYAVFDRADGTPENAQFGFAVSDHGAEAKDKLRRLAGKQATFGSQAIV